MLSPSWGALKTTHYGGSTPLLVRATHTQCLMDSDDYSDPLPVPPSEATNTVYSDVAAIRRPADPFAGLSQASQKIPLFSECLLSYF